MESGNFKDNCQLVVCYCVSSDHAYRNSMELFIPIVHAVRHNPAVSRNILTKKLMAASYMARIPQSRSVSCGSNSAYSRCTSMIFISNQLLFYCWLKVLGKSVDLCKTTKRKNQLYISLLVFCVENHLWKFQPKRTHIIWDMNGNINKENENNSGFGEALQ